MTHEPVIKLKVMMITEIFYDYKTPPYLNIPVAAILHKSRLISLQIVADFFDIIIKIFQNLICDHFCEPNLPNPELSLEKPKSPAAHWAMGGEAPLRQRFKTSLPIPPAWGSPGK